MINIVKNGVKPKRKRVIFKETCERCGCEFEFEYEDFIVLDRRLNGFATVNCPYCSERITKQINQYEHREVEDE